MLQSDGAGVPKRRWRTWVMSWSESTVGMAVPSDGGGASHDNASNRSESRSHLDPNWELHGSQGFEFEPGFQHCF